MPDANPGPSASGPAPVVPGPDGGRPRSGGVAYEDGWPLDLDAAAVVAAVREGGGSWRSVTVFPEIGSTNTVGMAMAAAGSPTGTVLVTDLQTAGRGRLERHWEAPPGTAALFSVVLRPEGADHPWGTFPLLVGVAVAEAVEAVSGVPISLKWPNDLVIRDQDAPSGRGGKVAGILAERDAATGAVVLGVGINVDLDEGDLPAPGAASLTLAGIPRPHRAAVIGRALARIEHWYRAWEAAGTDPAALDGLLARYRQRCLSVGASLRVALPAGQDLVGTGVGIGRTGELLVDVEGTVVPVVVGDVIHASADPRS